MVKPDWIIYIVGNGNACQDCGKIENPFPKYICNAHTHGMKKYGHPDFQLVIHMSQANIGYVLNTFGLRVQSGETFRSGDLVEGIFEDCPVRLHEFEESGRKVLRVIIPDSCNRFPEEPECAYPYKFQMLSMAQLEQQGSIVC